MSIRTFIIAVLALAAGGSAAMGVRQLVTANRNAQKTETVMIVIAKANVARGERLSENQLTVQPWPAKLAPMGACKDLKEVEGRVTLAAQFSGQPIFESQLAAKDAPSGLAALVPDGMRAFTIRMPTVQSGVAGFVLPGNKVDVLLTANSPRSGGAVTVTLVQAVEILAVDQKLDAPSKNKVDTAEFRSVTLLVTPSQASKLSLAGNKGTLQLALRNADDDDSSGSDPITLADLQSLSGEPGLISPNEVKPVAAAVEVPRQRTMRVRALRGSNDSYIVVRPYDVITEPSSETSEGTSEEP